MGARAQGIGQLLLEHVVYGEAGELITGAFIEYATPRVDDMPELVLDRTVTPSPLNPLGARGVGEGGACVTPPAIVNAVIDALSPFEIHHVDTPLTAEKIWRALRPGRADVRHTDRPESTAAEGMEIVDGDGRHGGRRRRSPAP